MKTRLITLFILIGLLPLLAATLFSHVRGEKVMGDVAQMAEKSMEQQISEQLQTIRDLSRRRIEDYFATTINQCLNISSYPFMVKAAGELRDAVRVYRREHDLEDESEIERLRKELWASYTGEFARAYKERNGSPPPQLEDLFAKLDPEAIALQHFYFAQNPHPVGAKFMKDTSVTTSHSCAYGRAHLNLHPSVRRFIESFGYADFLIVDTESLRVVYSYAKEIDFGASLRDGPFAGSNLAEAVREVIGQRERAGYAFARYEKYLPSLGDPACFVASGMYDGEKLAAIAVIQLPVDGVNRVMQTRSGLGQTGETYLVGPDHHLRSDLQKGVASRAETVTVRESFLKDFQISTEPVAKALGGESGVGLAQSYHDPQTPRLCAWSPVEVARGTRWALVAEIAEPEALALARRIDAQGKSAARGLLLLNGSIILIALIGVCLVAIVVARRLSSPLLQAAGNLQETVSKISAATTQLAASGAETAASISETSATVEEIRQTAHVSSDKAKGVEQAAQQAVQVSATGRLAVREAIEGMHTIQQRMETIAESIVHLSEQCQAIGEIIAAINDLADQSNLLAVNASIEAAKAGEEGRGFAVVAQEVRNLAEQSKQATAQVKSILRDIQKATTGAVMATEEGGKAVTAGVVQSEATGQAIEELARSIEGAAQAAIQIASTSQQQLIGMDQMVYAMENINQATGQNVDSARQLEETAHQMDQLGHELLQLVQSGAPKNGRRL